MHGLRWSKVHSQARYELTGSGAPAVRLADLDADLLPVSLEMNGAPGHLSRKERPMMDLPA